MEIYLPSEVLLLLYDQRNLREGVKRNFSPCLGKIGLRKGVVDDNLTRIICLGASLDESCLQVKIMC